VEREGIKKRTLGTRGSRCCLPWSVEMSEECNTARYKCAPLRHPASTCLHTLNTVSLHLPPNSELLKRYTYCTPRTEHFTASPFSISKTPTFPRTIRRPPARNFRRCQRRYSPSGHSPVSQRSVSVSKTIRSRALGTYPRPESPPPARQTLVIFRGSAACDAVVPDQSHNRD
jgi:hypothetical protein